MPKLILSPTMIRPLPNYIPFNNEGKSEIARKMENTLRLLSGVGADCVLKFPNGSLAHFAKVRRSDRNIEKYYDSLCLQQLSRYTGKLRRIANTSRPTHKARGTPRCFCSKDKRNYICDAGVEGHPDVIDTITGEQLLNVTGVDMPEYLMFTTEHFKRHRYV